jgi:hypothetical protein
MATSGTPGSGNWRARVRCKGRCLSETFRRQKDAEERTLDIERVIDRGDELSALKRNNAKLLSDLVSMHLADMRDIGRPARRPKAAVMEALKNEIRKGQVRDLTGERHIGNGRTRVKEGTGSDLQHLEEVQGFRSVSQREAT